MSYILDALKKSDNERKQGDVPNLQTIHIPINSEPPAPLALYGLISILLLLLAILIGWLFADKEMPSTEEGGIEVASIATSTTAPAVIAPIAITPVEIVRAAEPVRLPAVQQSDISVESKPVKPIKLKPLKKPVIIAAVKPTPQNNTDIVDLSEIPYLHEMPDYQQQSVPQMTFAGHVYSSNKASRSVIINDVFMSEGDALLPGINVVEITASGVVFSLHESFFRVDILQDWSFD